MDTAIRQVVDTTGYRMDTAIRQVVDTTGYRMDTAIRQVVDTGVQDGYHNQTGSRHNRVQDG